MDVASDRMPESPFFRDPIFLESDCKRCDALMLSTIPRPKRCFMGQADFFYKYEYVGVRFFLNHFLIHT